MDRVVNIVAEDSTSQSGSGSFTAFSSAHWAMARTLSYQVAPHVAEGRLDAFLSHRVCGGDQQTANNREI